jgi:hypothetical protein
MDQNFSGGFSNFDKWVDPSKFNLTFPFKELGEIGDNIYKKNPNMFVHLNRFKSNLMHFYLNLSIKNL